MGLDGMSMGSLLVILLIVMLLFGTKRLRSIGSDLGAAVRSFRRGLKEEEVDDASVVEQPSQLQQAEQDRHESH